MRRLSRLVLATAALAGGIMLSAHAEAQSPAPPRNSPALPACI